jgi:hypothetical protein
MSIKLRTLDSLSHEIYERISQDKPYDKKLKIYSKEEIEFILSYFEKKEDYEKCNIIHTFMKNRFNHKSRFSK